MFQHSSLVTQDDFIMSVRSVELFADVYNKEYEETFRIIYIYLADDEIKAPFTPFAMFYVYFGQYDDVNKYL